MTDRTDAVFYDVHCFIEQTKLWRTLFCWADQTNVHYFIEQTELMYTILLSRPNSVYHSLAAQDVILNFFLFTPLEICKPIIWITAPLASLL